MEGYKFIDRFGVEMEGLWRTYRSDLVPDLSLHDGVDFPNAFIRCPETGRKLPLFGELVSAPMDNTDEILNFIQLNWPTEVSPKCGLHFHVSLNSLGLYCHCMSRKFYDDFLNSVTEWGKKHCPNNKLFWDRLTDKNRYCRKRHIPDEQVVCRSKEIARERQVRATHFNYCYGQHKTFECRLFPMFDEFKTGQLAAMFFLNFVEDFLAKIPNRDADLVRSDEIFEDGEEESLPVNYSLEDENAPLAPISLEVVNGIPMLVKKAPALRKQFRSAKNFKPNKFNLFTYKKKIEPCPW